MKFCCECGRELKEEEECHCIENIDNNVSDQPIGVYDGEVKFGLLCDDHLDKLYVAIREKESNNNDVNKNSN